MCDFLRWKKVSCILPLNFPVFEGLLKTTIVYFLLQIFQFRKKFYQGVCLAPTCKVKHQTLKNHHELSVTSGAGLGGGKGTPGPWAQAGDTSHKGKLKKIASKLLCLMVKNIHDNQWTVSNIFGPYLRDLPLKIWQLNKKCSNSVNFCVWGGGVAGA